MPLKVSRRAKFGNVRARIDGLGFDSQGEARHYLVLRERQRLGEIAELRHPHVFELHVGSMKLGELRADFSFVDVATGRLVVQDFKGRHNRSKDVEYRFYRWKAAHVRAEYGIEIEEVRDDTRQAWARRVDARRDRRGAR